MGYRSRDQLLSHVLENSQVVELVDLRKEGMTLQQLAIRFKVHKSTVKNILKRYDNLTDSDKRELGELHGSR